MGVESESALQFWRQNRGVFSVKTGLRRLDSHLLSIIYTPGVAEPCRRIAADISKSYEYSGRAKTALLISNASQNITGGYTDIFPLLEARALLYKQLSGIDVYPQLVDAGDEELIDIIQRQQYNFGAVLLENVSEHFIETNFKQLQNKLDIPVLNSDNTGRAVACLGLVFNIARHLDCSPAEIKVSVTGKGPDCSSFKKLLRRAEIGTLPPDETGDSDLFFAFNCSEDVIKHFNKPENSGTIFVAAGWTEIPDTELEFKETVVPDVRAEKNIISSLLSAPGLLAGIINHPEFELSDQSLLELAGVMAGVVSDEELKVSRFLPEISNPAASMSVAASILNPLKNCKDIVARLRQAVYEREPDFSRRNIWDDLQTEDISELGATYSRSRGGPIYCSPDPKIVDRDTLRTVYHPGCRFVMEKLKDNPESSRSLTARSNLVAVATNGTAVLGLGDIGPAAARPVMEGKSALFKTFGAADAIPLCIEDDGDPEIFIDIVKKLAPSLGGINLEDISAPHCFEIEKRLKNELDIPVFHDDQHGTAVVIMAGLQSAAFLQDISLPEARVVINGAGAAGIAVAAMLYNAGVEEIILADSKGLIYPGRDNLNREKKNAAEWSNPRRLQGTLQDALKGADIFIGLSVGGLLDADDIKTMNSGAIVFALANPEPEIYPDAAYRGGAGVVATGRSDFPNQVNNALAFPGIFRGALDSGALDISEGMKKAAADALFEVARVNGLNRDYILPTAMDLQTSPRVAEAVARAAIEEKIATRNVEPDKIRRNMITYLHTGTLPPL